MKIVRVDQSTPCYPEALRVHLGDRAPASLVALGDPAVLGRKSLALFCSVRCPGDLILRTYDLAQQLRDAGIPVIGGFHSPMERECLVILLRGDQPIILCPARGIAGMRVRPELRAALEKGRLLILSPFPETLRRPTAQTALYRNQFVAALADHIFVAYAEPGGKTEQFIGEIAVWRKPLLTFASEANRNLIDLGAQPIGADGICR